jgi:hypothetical protein
MKVLQGNVKIILIRMKSQKNLLKSCYGQVSGFFNHDEHHGFHKEH